MSTKAKAAASGPRFDPARRYSVQLSRAVEWPPNSRRYLSPGKQTELRGDVAAQLADAVASADLIPEPGKGPNADG